MTRRHTATRRGPAWRAPWLGAVLWLSLGCQDGYPISATRCDEWCDASQALDCGTYDPAECVVGCETARLGAPECQADLDSALSCLRGKTASELSCETWATSAKGPPCRDERLNLLGCGAGFVKPGSAPGE